LRLSARLVATIFKTKSTLVLIISTQLLNLGLSETPRLVEISPLRCEGSVYILTCSFAY